MKTIQVLCLVVYLVVGTMNVAYSREVVSPKMPVGKEPPSTPAAEGENDVPPPTPTEDGDDVPPAEDGPEDIPPTAENDEAEVGGPPQGVVPLSDTPTSSPPAVFIPFGKHVQRDPNLEYILATGVQECMVCKGIIEEAWKYGPAFADLCELMPDEMQEMCQAQQRVLQSCPEFTNNWCYQDLGGTQQLRSPCPAFLKCHYCLGMNPLHCVDNGDE